MKKSQIKQKLNNFLEDFQKESGGFKSFEVVYEYINFLKSEKYTKKLLRDVWEYANEQKNIMAKAMNSMEKEDLILDPANICKLPVFAKEMKIYQKRINEKKEIFNVYELVPIMLMNLMSAHEIMDSIKNNEPAGSLKQVNNLDVSALLKNTKKESMGIQSIKVLPDKNVIVENSKFYEASIEIVNKYIIDQIDSEEFLSKGQNEIKLSFDKEKSKLNIFGQTVKIQLKNDKPNDHYVLEYLFEQDDIFDEADFQDIAKEKLGMSEYDNTKDWNVLRHACDNLNKKVDKSTKAQEKEFLIYTTGKTGWCKINPKYL